MGASRQLKRWIARGFVALFLCTGLGAYSIWSVPFVWIAQAGEVALAAALIIGLNRVRNVPGGLVFIVFIAWALIVNILNAECFASMMPAMATLPYGLFIIVRYVNLLAFAAVFYLTFWLMTQGYSEFLVKGIVGVGTLVSLAALYIYIAQIYGLPEPSRTRMGTGGGEQATTFSLGSFFYTRALGTFREPSHLAEWLVLPLFFSLARSNRAARVGTFLIGTTLLLTVSLTGILSAMVGGVAAILISNPLRLENLKRLVGVAAVLSVLAIGLQIVSVNAADEEHSITSIVSLRTLEILEGGLGSSNRGHTYEFIADNPFPLVGYGLGNANIFISNAFGSDLVMSYLSLYINTLYSTGIVGLGLLLVFLVSPIIRNLAKRESAKLRHSPVFLMTYLAYLVSFGVNVDELSVPFAISAAFLAHQGALGSRLKGHVVPHIRFGQAH